MILRGDLFRAWTVGEVSDAAPVKAGRSIRRKCVPHLSRELPV